MTTEAPLACSLSATDYTNRLAWITALNTASLRSNRRVGGRLTLVYAADAVVPVRELVRREQECCAFLRFTVTTSEDAVSLDVRVPDTAVDAAGDLLAPFLAGSAPQR